MKKDYIKPQMVAVRLGGTELLQSTSVLMPIGDDSGGNIPEVKANYSFPGSSNRQDWDDWE